MSEAAKESAMTTDEGTSSLYKGLTFSYDGGPLLSNQAIKDRKEWLKTNQWDTISIGRHIPSNIKYVVVDVETHDWDIFDRNNRSKSRIVELAWLAYNASGVIVDSKQYLIKPHGYKDKEISSKAVEVHGITTKCAIEYGNYASDVFTEFVSILRALLRDGIVVAYNMINEHQTSRPIGSSFHRLFELFSILYEFYYCSGETVSYTLSSTIPIVASHVVLAKILFIN